MKITKKLFENVATFEYLDMILKIKTNTHKEIKRLHSGGEL